MPDYKFNLEIRVRFDDKKTVGTIAEIIEPLLENGIAEYTPQFGENHWSLRFPDLTVEETKNLLSKFAKSVLK